MRRLRAENAQLRQDLASCRQQLAALHAALKRQQPYARGAGGFPPPRPPPATRGGAGLDRLPPERVERVARRLRSPRPSGSICWFLQSIVATALLFYRCVESRRVLAAYQQVLVPWYRYLLACKSMSQRYVK